MHVLRMLVFASIISRIWILCKSIKMKVGCWYKTLLAICFELKPMSNPLIAIETMPSSLSGWLNDNDTVQEVPNDLQKEALSIVSHMYSDIGEDKGERIDRLEYETLQTRKLNDDHDLPSNEECEDKGERIDRLEYETFQMEKLSDHDLPSNEECVVISTNTSVDKGVCIDKLEFEIPPSLKLNAEPDYTSKTENPISF